MSISDAIEAYRAEVTLLVHEKNNKCYRNAAAFVTKIRDFYILRGLTELWEQHQAALRQVHKQQRNFMPLLDGMERLRT